MKILNPRIAVIMPWGGQSIDFLRRAMISVDQQTYKNLEKILICDGFSVNEEIKKQFPDWMYLKNSTDIRGPASTRNLAFESLAHEIEYILLADADDISHPNRAEKLLTQIAQSQIDILGSQGVIIDTRKNHGKNRIYPYPNMVNINTIIENKLKNGQNAFLAPSVLMKREVIEIIGLYDVTLLRGEDLDYFQRACTFGFKLGNSDDFLYGYRTAFWTPIRNFKKDWQWSGRRMPLLPAYLLHIGRRFSVFMNPMRVKRVKSIWNCHVS